MASPQINAAPTASTRSILTSLGIVILAQLPMLLVYFGELWKRPHYRFFPVAILAVLLLAYRAWPREKFRVLKSSRASLVMLFSGCASAILGYVLMVPWFSMLSLCLIVTSGLLLIYDEDSRRSLGIQALPLFFILLVPLNGDYQFLSFLHRPSSDFASRILEVRGVGHLLTGATIEMAGKSFEIENASRGVQSCFVLLFCSQPHRGLEPPQPVSLVLPALDCVPHCDRRECPANRLHPIRRPVSQRQPGNWNFSRARWLHAVGSGSVYPLERRPLSSIPVWSCRRFSRPIRPFFRNHYIYLEPSHRGCPRSLGQPQPSQPSPTHFQV